MTDYVARKYAAQIDALNGDAPLGAVCDLVVQSAPVEVRQAVARFRQRSRACQEGDDVALLRHNDPWDAVCAPDSAPAKAP